MQRVLLTGVTGFIGSEIAHKLINDNNYEVVGVVRTSSNKDSLTPIKDIMNKIAIRQVNLADYSAVRKFVKDIAPNYIIHVGAITAVRDSFEIPLEYQDVNYNSTVNLIHSALDVPDFKKFIFASTMEVYGWQNQRFPFKEDIGLNPGSPYSASKFAAEQYIRMAGKAYGLPYIVSRACNTFGRKNNAGFIVEYIITKMLKNETVYIGTPNAVRDMMYVDDHVNAYLTSLKSKVSGEVFNFGTGNQMKMIDLAEKIRQITGSNSQIVPSFPPDYPWRPVVEEYLSLDANKAKQMLGWEPKVSLEDGLKRTTDFWKMRL